LILCYPDISIEEDNHIAVIALNYNSMQQKWELDNSITFTVRKVEPRTHQNYHFWAQKSDFFLGKGPGHSASPDSTPRRFRPFDPCAYGARLDSPLRASICARPLRRLNGASAQGRLRRSYGVLSTIDPGAN